MKARALHAGLTALLLAQGVAAATPPQDSPAFAPGTGPVVVIDGGHHNHHTMDNRFAPFAALLRRDGFRVRAVSAPFTAGLLDGIEILVIANALNAVNVDAWALPTPSAFSAEEIAAVQRWVEQGGALLLIADHFPFPGAAGDLARAFGFEFSNAFALAAPPQAVDIFSAAAGTLGEHPIVQGRDADGRVTAIATFTGSAFSAPPGAQPLLVLPEDFVLLLPTVAWQFDDNTPWRPGQGYLQGATLRHSAGRVAVFGEAAMFTAHWSDGEERVPIGFNAPEADQNAQFIVNTLRWLAGTMPEESAR